MLIGTFLKASVYTSIILYIVNIQHSILHIKGTQQKFSQQMYKLRQQEIGPRFREEEKSRGKGSPKRNTAKY